MYTIYHLKGYANTVKCNTNLARKEAPGDSILQHFANFKAVTVLLLSSG